MSRRGRPWSRDGPRGRRHPIPYRRSGAAIILLLLLATLPAAAQDREPRDPDPPMPDPCEIAPVLPFCR